MSSYPLSAYPPGPLHDCSPSTCGIRLAYHGNGNILATPTKAILHTNRHVELEPSSCLSRFPNVQAQLPFHLQGQSNFTPSLSALRRKFKLKDTGGFRYSKIGYYDPSYEQWEGIVRQMSATWGLARVGCGFLLPLTVYSIRRLLGRVQSRLQFLPRPGFFPVEYIYSMQINLRTEK
ncbi:hypothetical protein GALMADRAFT_1352657 [Galerina marginata CBS 339.88]|uniref:Uncharacterized protein n=1 Tax=Galerina marginata (strain CBS 339.88) TaxID=685588 RepID=A0A067SGR1_GALM3|nr:hypothetical protein GALMADRAFT_1352657 [Galerina marginata CBS 339.88]